MLSPGSCKRFDLWLETHDSCRQLLIVAGTTTAAAAVQLNTCKPALLDIPSAESSPIMYYTARLAGDAVYCALCMHAVVSISWVHLFLGCCVGPPHGPRFSLRNNNIWISGIEWAAARVPCDHCCGHSVHGTDVLLCCSSLLHYKHVKIYSITHDYTHLSPFFDKPGTVCCTAYVHCKNAHI